MKAPSELWRRVRASPGLVHGATLALGFVVLVLLGRGQWFVYDDWTILTLTDPLRSHQGHWNTVPTLLYTALFEVFGLHTYLPYLVPAIVAHLVVAHLVWRLCLRVGVSPWLATAGVVPVIFFGSASENLFWGFQIGFMGSMAFALGALVLVARPRMSRGAVVAAAILAVAGLPFGSTGLPILAAAGIVTLVRHGWLRALVVFGPAAAVYLAWFLTLRVPSPDVLAPHGMQYLTAVPVFFAVIITAAYGQWLGPLVLGPLLALGILVWLARDVRQWLGERAVAYALLVGVVVFAVLTSLTRGGMVIQAAAAERYVYVVIMMSLPTILLIVDRAWRAAGLARVAAALAILAVAAVNAQLLVERSAGQAAFEQRVRADLAAAADLVADEPGLPDGARPVYEGAPDITIADVRRFLELDVLRDAEYDDGNVDRVEHFIDVTS